MHRGPEPGQMDLEACPRDTPGTPWTPSYLYCLIQDTLPQRWFQRYLLNQIDFYTQDIRKHLFDPDIRKERYRSCPVELDEEVEIACLILFTPDVGAEDLD